MSREAKPTARLSKARSEAAKELKLPVTDFRTRRFAIISVAIDNAEALLAAGGSIDIKQLLDLEAALTAIKQSLPKEPIAVTIDIVDGAKGIFDCQHCGKRNEIEDYHAPEPTPASKQIDGAVVGKPDAKQIAAPKVEAPAPAPGAAAPKPVNPSMAAWERAHGRVYGRSSKDGGLIHGAPAFDPSSKYNQGNNGAAVWSGYDSRPSNAVAGAEPNPLRNPDGTARNGHALPTPTGKV
jgi:hypothetical protein